MRCARGVAGSVPVAGAGVGGGDSAAECGRGAGGGCMASKRALSVALALLLLTPLLLVLDEQPLQLLPWLTRSAEPEAAAQHPAFAAASPGRGKGVDVFRGEPALGEEHIFFVETSCALDVRPQPGPYDSASTRDRNMEDLSSSLGEEKMLLVENTLEESGLRLSPRGACAVEAAAAAHPTHRVYLVHTCQVRRRSLAKGAAPAYALAALSAPNVRLWAVPYARHYVGTPLHDWLARGALRASHWPVVHASDVLRFLLLWKYGGTYLDLDVLMLRSLGEEKNFGCAESPVDVSVGAFNFALDEPGRRVANACVAELLHYRPDLWSYNGPGAITRALKRVCNVQEIPEMTENKCGGFHLLPTSTFYAIPWQNWNLFFTEESSEETMKMIGKNLAVHVWNALSHNTTVDTSSKQPYAQIARRVCPNVVAAMGDTM